jgi:hypothetical protein
MVFYPLETRSVSGFATIQFVCADDGSITYATDDGVAGKRIYEIFQTIWMLASAG